VDEAGRNVYRFGDFELNAAERILMHGTRPIQLAPRVFDTLHLLVQNHGRVLSKDRMLTEVWEGSFVEENNLAQNISLLRKILGGENGKKFIETVPKFGYRFVEKVDIAGGSEGKLAYSPLKAGGAGTSGEELPAGPEPSATEMPTANKPVTQYVQNGDVNIAYQVVGEGDFDLVFVMGWVSHLEYFWEEPHFAAFLNRLASFSRLILFDKRGTGLSDRVPLSELPTLEQRMEDVHAVMNAVGSKRAVLIGVSEGGPMCSLFAATYPERTAALIMIGTYAKRIKDDEYPWGVSAEDRQEFFEMMRRDWGKPVGIEERAPSLADNEAFRSWWATYLRMGASPGAAVTLTQMNAEIDVRNVLPSVRVPTLVIHRKGDRCLKVEEGRFVASKIPGSKYVEFEGVDHLPFVGDQDEILDSIEEFLTGTNYPADHDRVLATVLSIKFLGSPDADTLKRAKAHIRRQLELFKGNEVSIEDAGVLATFDGPARAIRCASAIIDSADRLALKLKTGLHTGECDLVGQTYSGFAVELAEKIASASKSGNMLVSRTVKDLVAGSGLTFEEVGMHSFPGIEGEWRLFTVVR
jgi:pimeloyl-ACP methyl ester carboxylesterase/DNA-binding winged helix-turn-helix (wHTH) protein